MEQIAFAIVVLVVSSFICYLTLIVKDLITLRKLGKEFLNDKITMKELEQKWDKRKYVL
jgi:hypothetical protein